MKFTKEQKRAFSRIGKLGGKASALAKTPEQRRAQALRAITARWDRVRAAQAETMSSDVQPASEARA